MITNLRNKPVPLWFLAALLPLLALMISGCAKMEPKPAALSNDEVTQVTENLLQATNSRDLEAFTRDMGPTLKEFYTQDEFTKLCDLLLGTTGQYVSLGRPSLSNNKGYAIYSFSANFMQEEAVVTVVFPVDGKTVEGLFFNSANLRKSNQ